MSRIRWSETPDSQWVQRDGRFLHSQRDPLREAGIWVSGRPEKLKDMIFVLGLGAGFHVREWIRQCPTLCLVICDFDRELFAGNQIDCVNEFKDIAHAGPGVHGLCLNSETQMRPLDILIRGYSVVRFRPAWAGREPEFSAFEDCLLDRSAAQLGDDFLTQSQNWPQGLDVNIKSLGDPTIGFTEPQDQKLLAALRELVR